MWTRVSQRTLCNLTIYQYKLQKLKKMTLVSLSLLDALWKSLRVSTTYLRPFLCEAG